MNDQLPTPDKPKDPVTVIWSGGFDSTAVIIKYLEEGRSVSPVSVSLSNNADQATAEKAARLRIYNLLVKEFGWDKLQKAKEYNWPHLDIPYGRELALPQPPIWIYMATMNSPTDEVAFGWVRHDDVWHYRNWIYTLTEAFDAFKGKKTTILLPFEWDTKEDLLRYYQKRENVFNLISTSECGEDWRLGNDKKCIEMQGLYKKLKSKINSEKREMRLKKKEAAKWEKADKEKALLTMPVMMDTVKDTAIVQTEKFSVL
jgi:hypothetical protein